MPVPQPRPRKIIGIVGSRRRNTEDDCLLCCIAFSRIYRPGDCIVSGGCRKGADNFAELIAAEYGLSVVRSKEEALALSSGGIIIHYPDFDTYGSPFAYFQRNGLIAVDCTTLVAVVALDRTGGTEDTIRKTLALSKPVHIITDATSPIFRV